MGHMMSDTLGGRSRYPLVVVLLGSYDDDTKEILYMLKDGIAREYAGGENEVYAFLLERLSVYELDKGVLFLERMGADLYTAYLFSMEGMMIDVSDVRGSEDEALFWVEGRYGVRVERRMRELDKLKRLADYPLSLIFLVREKELTAASSTGSERYWKSTG